MSVDQTPSLELTGEMLRLKQGEHLCLVYDDDPAEQMDALLPYIRHGLKSGERCVYVADDQTVDQLSAALTAYGIDVPLETERGALHLWTRDEWRPPGEFDSARMGTHLRDAIDSAVVDGFSGARFAIEMTWTLGPDIDLEQLRHWEASINTIVTPDAPSRMICQYSRSRLAPAVLRAGLCTHPTVILGADVVPNPYYDAPLLLEAPESVDAAPESTRVDWMISRLRWARAVERERAQRVQAEQSKQQIEELYREAQEARAAAEEHAALLGTVNRINRIISAELDLDRAVQAVTDEATEVTRAAFGAFFYNVIDESGESYTLYSLSGADRSTFEQFPLPRNTAVFGPTFRGEGTVCLDDVQQDPRYGKNRPYYGMPAGHLPVRSYLAVPVRARSGEVLGGLFFGHEQTGVFTERDERTVEGIAAQAAIAIENARLYEEAQRSVQMRDQFLAIAAHEFKTPLTVLNGFVQLLDRRLTDDAVDPSRLRHPVEQLVTYSARLSELVNDLLDTSRIQRDRLDLQPEVMDLTTLARTVIDRFEHDPLHTPQHTLRLDAPHPVEGEWDLGRIDQVLTNLVNNALKYSPDGGEVRVTIRRIEGDAQLAVSDRGLGIPHEEQAELFQPFRRGHADRRVIAGTGLGLYVSSQIVARHGGTISFESEPGQGSTFQVRLPLHPEASIASD